MVVFFDGLGDEGGDSMSREEHENAIEVSIIFHEGQRMFAVPKQPAPVQPVAWAKQILDAFPLFDDDGLNEEEHHCEWALQQDRKRLHSMLATPPAKPAAAPVQDASKQFHEWAVAEHATLTTALPAQRQWVGLTDIEKLSVCRVGPAYAPDGVVTRTPIQYRKELEGVALMAVRQAEAKLKELNT
jgi:hypothetical protein